MFAEMENSSELWLIKVKKVLNGFLQLQENSEENGESLFLISVKEMDGSRLPQKLNGLVRPY